MSLLSVVKDVCLNVGVLVPTSVFTNIAASRTMQEMLSLANEMAQRICYDTRDWTRLRQIATFTGDVSGTVDYDLPANYKRMILTSNVWRSDQTVAPMSFVPDPDEWVRRRLNNYTHSRGEWTLYGGQIHFAPALPNTVKAQFVYLDKNCVKLNAGGVGQAFVNDADEFVLDERLLKLGMIWQWKAKKGSPYAEDMGTYGDALTLAMGKDAPAPIIHGGQPISANATIAYPYPVPTP